LPNFYSARPLPDNDHYWTHGDKGIAKQLWCIRDKLQEVNEAMTPQHQSRLQETHPELVFWHLNNKADNKADLGNKKTDAGRRRRIALLKSHGFDRIEIWLSQRWGTGIGRDDLIDACACALAAREHNGVMAESPEIFTAASHAQKAADYLHALQAQTGTASAEDMQEAA
jgi:predicted RNase H-like nuclease